MNEAREIPILQISEQNPVSGDIQMRQLLELILQQIEFETNLPETWTEPNKPQLLLELDVNGVHYTLARQVESADHHFPEPEPKVHTHLSPREQEIIRLVARGLCTKAIAAVLDVSPWTVSTHLRRIFLKVGANSRAEMIAKVLEYGSI